MFKNQNHAFSQDCLAIITPYSSHSIISEGKMTVLVLEFDLEIIEPSMREILHQYSFFDTKLVKLNVLDAGNVRQLLRRMLYEQSLGKAINIVAMKIYMAELLLHLLRIQEEPDITAANVLRADRLRKYMDTHYFEIMDSNDISQKFGISTRHANAIFKEQFDKTPMQYLNEVRMEAAKRLLMETNNDISSICFEVGFEALSTFYRRFKEYTGISPNKFRIKYNYQYLDC